MNWYLVHTKPWQERVALVNLEQQGYECYLPTISSERIRQGELTFVSEPLFPRYLFIRHSICMTAKSWSPIRSTKGVSRLVSFAGEPAKIDDVLIEKFRVHEAAMQKQPLRLLVPGDRVLIKNGAFAGIEAIYKMKEGESRVMVLIELLSKQVRMSVALSNLRKIS